MMTFPIFVARGAAVWQAPIRTEHPDGTASLQLGCAVCTVDPAIEGRAMAARQIAAGLTLIQRLEDMEKAAKDAQRLIDDLTRNISKISIPDYALLNEVPLQLAQLRGWLELTRQSMQSDAAANAA